MGLFQPHVRHRRSNGPPDVTNQLALWIGASLVAFFAADQIWLDWNTHITFGKYLISWIDYLAFWR